MQTNDPLKSPAAFLAIADQFKLGNLITETQNPDSIFLSELAKRDIPSAIDCCKSIDLKALSILETYAPLITELAEDIKETLDSGGRIFLCGCGATGRLSITLECIWRELNSNIDDTNKVIAFMSGGDAALIRSIEKFEDFPEYGKRQLEELEFGRNDRLIAITEGGETPFVIGATHAGLVSRWKPWFIYCNPDSILREVAERSKIILDHPGIKKLNLSVGPMTLSGSTRMQASTVQLFSVGLALGYASSPNPTHIDKSIEAFIELFHKLDLSFLTSFIEAEYQTYIENNWVMYRTDKYGITVLTDTTERSPTFSLHPFENFNTPIDPPSYCYLNIANTQDATTAWNNLLKRPPRTLNWKGFESLTTRERLLGFDISDQGINKRSLTSEDRKQLPYDIFGSSVILEFAGMSKNLELTEQPLIFKHLILKLILNTQSTIVMGRLGRYEGNLMTYVRPSNLKLIDRAARYVSILYRAKSSTDELPYEKAVRAVFTVKEKLDHQNIRSDTPTVLEALKEIIL